MKEIWANWQAVMYGDTPRVHNYNLVVVVDGKEFSLTEAEVGALLHVLTERLSEPVCDRHPH